MDLTDLQTSVIEDYVGHRVDTAFEKLDKKIDLLSGKVGGISVDTTANGKHIKECIGLTREVIKKGEKKVQRGLLASALHLFLTLYANVFTNWDTHPEVYCEEVPRTWMSKRIQISEDLELTEEANKPYAFEVLLWSCLWPFIKGFSALVWNFPGEIAFFMFAFIAFIFSLVGPKPRVKKYKNCLVFYSRVDWFLFLCTEWMPDMRNKWLTAGVITKTLVTISANPYWKTCQSILGTFQILDACCQYLTFFKLMFSHSCVDKSVFDDQDFEEIFKDGKGIYKPKQRYEANVDSKPTANNAVRGVQVKVAAMSTNTPPTKKTGKTESKPIVPDIVVKPAADVSVPKPVKVEVENEAKGKTKSGRGAKNSKVKSRKWVNYDKLEDTDVISWVDGNEIAKMRWAELRDTGFWSSGVNVISVSRNGRILEPNEFECKAECLEAVNLRKRVNQPKVKKAPINLESLNPVCPSPKAKITAVPAAKVVVVPAEPNNWTTVESYNKKSVNSSKKRREKRTGNTKALGTGTLPVVPVKATVKVVPKQTKTPVKKESAPVASVAAMVTVPPPNVQAWTQVPQSVFESQKTAVPHIAQKFFGALRPVFANGVQIANAFVQPASGAFFNQHVIPLGADTIKGRNVGEKDVNIITPPPNSRRHGVDLFQTPFCPTGVPALKIGRPAPEMPVTLFTNVQGKDLLVSGKITEVREDGTFGFSETTMPGYCGGIYVNDVGTVVGQHYLGVKGAPNRGLSLPLN
jgi:hypothetical protein